MMNSEIQEYNNLLTGEEKKICDTLMEEIAKHLKGTTSKIRHGHPVRFLEENPIVGYSKQKRGIVLLFWSGQSFEEAGLSAEGTFKAAEKVYTSSDQIDIEELENWLKKSRAIQRDYKNIVKCKGQLERLS